MGGGDKERDEYSAVYNNMHRGGATTKLASTFCVVILLRRSTSAFRFGVPRGPTATTGSRLPCVLRYDPVGRCRKVHGSPKRVSRNSPSACTPSVSVA